MFHKINENKTKVIDEIKFVEQSNLFYEKYQDQFVSVYVSTNIDKDIAESWAVFVLNDKPLDVTMSEQKIDFFMISLN